MDQVVASTRLRGGEQLHGHPPQSPCAPKAAGTPVDVLGMRLLTLALVCSAVGCGPTLREPTTFTPDKVREALFADRCQLQRYYNTNLPP